MIEKFCGFNVIPLDPFTFVVKPSEIEEGDSGTVSGGFFVKSYGLGIVLRDTGACLVNPCELFLRCDVFLLRSLGKKLHRFRIFSTRKRAPPIVNRRHARCRKMIQERPWLRTHILKLIGIINARNIAKVTAGSSLVEIWRISAPLISLIFNKTSIVASLQLCGVSHSYPTSASVRTSCLLFTMSVKKYLDFYLLTGSTRTSERDCTAMRS